MLFNSEKLKQIYRCLKQQKEVDFMETLKTMVIATIATLTNTINYEVVCQFQKRVTILQYKNGERIN